jgi:hypothetical protein
MLCKSHLGGLGSTYTEGPRPVGGGPEYTNRSIFGLHNVRWLPCLYSMDLARNLLLTVVVP